MLTHSEAPCDVPPMGDVAPPPAREIDPSPKFLLFLLGQKCMDVVDRSFTLGLSWLHSIVGLLSEPVPGVMEHICKLADVTMIVTPRQSLMPGVFGVSPKMLTENKVVPLADFLAWLNGDKRINLALPPHSLQSGTHKSFELVRSEIKVNPKNQHVLKLTIASTKGAAGGREVWLPPFRGFVVYRNTVPSVAPIPTFGVFVSLNSVMWFMQEQGLDFGIGRGDM